MYFSIMGDSISTFEGFNPYGFRVYYDAERAYENAMTGVECCWWYQVIHRFEGKLCVNNSYSGSTVAGEAFPSACGEYRCGGLSAKSEIPDVILIYMGTNDYGFNVPVGKIGENNKNLNFFAEAYLTMLRNIRKYYPKAKVFCGNILDSRYMRDGKVVDPPDGKYTKKDFDEAIRYACLQTHCTYLEIYKENTPVYEALDGIHPTARGHRQIADLWITALKPYFGE